MLPKGNMIEVLGSVSQGVGAYILHCGDGRSCLPSLNPLSIGIQWLSPLVLIPSLLSNLLFMIWFPSEPGRYCSPNANTCITSQSRRHLFHYRKLKTNFILGVHYPQWQLVM